MLAAVEMGMRPTLVLMKTLQRWRCEFGRAPQESPPWHMQDASLIMLFVLCCSESRARDAPALGRSAHFSVFLGGGKK